MSFNVIKTLLQVYQQWIKPLQHELASIKAMLVPPDPPPDQNDTTPSRPQCRISNLLPKRIKLKVIPYSINVI